MKNILTGLRKPRLASYQWYDKIARYLDLPPKEVQKALGVKGGYTQNDKLAFSLKYDQGARIITTINRNAEINGNLMAGWAKLKYIPIVQEFTGFKLIGLIWKNILPMIENATSGSNQEVLDYGCGTSIFGRLLLERYPDTSLTLCDVDGHHFRFALEECKKLKSSTLGVKINSMTKPPLINKKYDFIYCYSVLEHIPNVFEILNFLCEHLKGNGVFLETFAGKTGIQPSPDPTDSKKAWDQRDKCFDYLYSSDKLVQIFGKKLRKLTDGHYPKSDEIRCWQRVDFS